MTEPTTGQGSPHRTVRTVDTPGTVLHPHTVHVLDLRAQRVDARLQAVPREAPVLAEAISSRAWTVTIATWNAKILWDDWWRTQEAEHVGEALIQIASPDGTAIAFHLDTSYNEKSAPVIANRCTPSLGSLFHACNPPTGTPPADTEEECWAIAARLHEIALFLPRAPQAPPFARSRRGVTTTTETHRHETLRRLAWALLPRHIAEEWRNAGVGSVYDAIPYYRAGWTPEAAAPWIAIGWHCEDARIYTSAGWTPLHATTFTRMLFGGFVDGPFDIAHTPWITTGLPAHLAILAAAAGLTPGEARRAARHGDLHESSLRTLAALRGVALPADLP